MATYSVTAARGRLTLEVDGKTIDPDSEVSAPASEWAQVLKAYGNEAVRLAAVYLQELSTKASVPTPDHGALFVKDQRRTAIGSITIDV